MLLPIIENSPPGIEGSQATPSGDEALASLRGGSAEAVLRDERIDRLLATSSPYHLFMMLDKHRLSPPRKELLLEKVRHSFEYAMAVYENLEFLRRNLDEAFFVALVRAAAKQNPTFFFTHAAPLVGHPCADELFEYGFSVAPTGAIYHFDSYKAYPGAKALFVKAVTAVFSKDRPGWTVEAQIKEITGLQSCPIDRVECERIAAAARAVPKTQKVVTHNVALAIQG